MLRPEGYSEMRYTWARKRDRITNVYRNCEIVCECMVQFKWKGVPSI